MSRAWAGNFVISPGLRHVFVPVGGGGLYSAVCRGLEGAGVHTQPPSRKAALRLSHHGSAGAERIMPVESTTRISGLAVPSISMRHSRCNYCGEAAARDTRYRTTTFSKRSA